MLETLTKLGLGCASIGNLYRAISDAEAAETVEAAWQAGMRYFDTAPYYGLGLSERRVGDVLRGMPRHEYCLSTKVGRLLDPDVRDGLPAERYGFVTSMPFKPRYDYSYAGIMRSYEASLQRLGLARIDLLLVHDIGRVTHGDAHQGHFSDLADGGYRALDELRRNGDVGAIGLGVNEWEVCDEAIGIGTWDYFLLAGRYTLLEQEPLHGFLPRCEAHGAKIILGGAYNSGILATGTHRDAPALYNYAPAPPEIIARVRKMEGVCADHGITLAAAALQFPLAHQVIASVIPGLGAAARVRETMQLLGEAIPAQFWADLKAHSLLDPAAPTPAGGLSS